MIPYMSGATTAIGTRIKSVRPKFYSKGQSVTIVHREALSYVNVINGNEVQLYGNVNPYNPYLFPWLSMIASSYDKFKVNALVFEYVPTCATTQTGSVTIAWDPVSTDYTPDYFDLSNMHSVQSTLWLPAKLAVKPSGIKYMGEQVANTGTGSEIYNHGKLLIGTQSSGTNITGTLFVSYSITLLEPQPATGLSSVFKPTPNGSGSLMTITGPIDGFSTLSVGVNYLKIPMGTWQIAVKIYGTGLTSLGWANSGGISTASGFTSVTDGSTLMYIRNIKSTGAFDATVSFSPVYTTLLDVSVRLTKVDPAAYLNSAIVI